MDLLAHHPNKEPVGGVPPDTGIHVPLPACNPTISKLIETTMTGNPYELGADELLVTTSWNVEVESVMALPIPWVKTLK